MQLEDIEENSTALDCYNVSTPINVEFQNICYKRALSKDATDRRQYILKNVSGSFYSSRLTAVVGMQGSGKTTLLNLLAGLKSNHAASNIKLNGRTSDTNSIRKKSCYITPDFPLHQHLTTFETLQFAADFKLSRKMSAIAKLKLINNIIAQLNLINCRNLRISKLSEPQRNLVALGVGLITKSSVLYLNFGAVQDLEDVSIMFVLSYLKDLAAQGRTIICAFNRPTTRMLQYFDDIILLADGHSVHSGAVDKMDVAFSKLGIFQTPNLGLAEFILDIAAQSEPNGKYQHLLLNDNKITVYNEPNSDNIPNQQNWSYSIGYWSQLTILMRRNILCMVRDLLFVQLRLLTNIIIGVFLGLVFYNFGNDAALMYSNTSLLFFMVMFVFFVNIFPNVLSFPIEFTISMQEHKQRYYSMEVYCIVKIITESFQHIIGPTVFLVIVFFLTSQPVANFIYIWNVFTMTSVVALGTSLVICTVIQNSTLRLYTIIFFNVPMMIFSGMFIKYNELSPYFEPAIYISYFRYAFEGSMQSIYGFNRPALSCSTEFCYFKKPDRFLEAIFMGGDIYWFDIGGLAIWIVISFVFYYVVIKCKQRLSRNK